MPRIRSTNAWLEAGRGLQQVSQGVENAIVQVPRIRAGFAMEAARMNQQANQFNQRMALDRQLGEAGLDMRDRELGIQDRGLALRETLGQGELKVRQGELGVRQGELTLQQQESAQLTPIQADRLRAEAEAARAGVGLTEAQATKAKVEAQMSLQDLALMEAQRDKLTELQDITEGMMHAINRGDEENAAFAYRGALQTLMGINFGEDGAREKQAAMNTLNQLYSARDPQTAFASMVGGTQNAFIRTDPGEQVFDPAGRLVATNTETPDNVFRNPAVISGALGVENARVRSAFGAPVETPVSDFVSQGILGHSPTLPSGVVDPVTDPTDVTFTPPSGDFVPTNTVETAVPVNTQEEYDQLSSGTFYIDGSGQVKRKP